MANGAAPQTSMTDLGVCWWVFAVRGGLALIFALVLFLASIFLGIFFFDPVTLVSMSLLLGSFVLGNGLLLGVAAGFAYEHRLHFWWLILGECCFAVSLGLYIGISLMLTAKSLAFLAGLHALGNGVFQLSMAMKLRAEYAYMLLLGAAGLVSLLAGSAFLSHVHQGARTTTQALAAFELLSGLLWITVSLRSRAKLGG